MQRFTILEGWRALLAWWVVLSHTMGHSGFQRGYFAKAIRDIEIVGFDFFLILERIGLELALQGRTGKLPVYIFIMISGFVITHLLTHKKERYDVYLVRRFFRLWPALFFVLCAIALANLLGFQLRNTDDFWLHFILESTMFHGLVPDQIFKDASQAISGPGWSISLEWQFYIVAPFILTAFAKGGWRIMVFALVLIFFAAIGLLNDKSTVINGVELTWGPPAFLPHMIGFFAAGIISYKMMTMFKQNDVSVKFGLGLILICGLVGSSFTGSEGNYIPIMLWVVILGTILASGTIFHTLIDNKPMNWLGTISYSTYITHMPILAAVKIYIVNDMAERQTLEHFLWMIAIAWPIVLLVSIFSYYVIEKPGIRLGRTIANRLQKPPQAKMQPSTPQANG